MDIAIYKVLSYPNDTRHILKILWPGCFQLSVHNSIFMLNKWAHFQTKYYALAIHHYYVLGNLMEHLGLRSIFGNKETIGDKSFFALQNTYSLKLFFKKINKKSQRQIR